MNYMNPYFWFEGKKIECLEMVTTVRHVFEMVGENPDRWTLAKKTQGGIVEYHNLDEEIEIHQNSFTLFDKKPTYNA